MPDIFLFVDEPFKAKLCIDRMFKGGKDQSLKNSTDVMYHACNGIEPSSNATWTIITPLCFPGLFFLVLPDEEQPAYLLNHNMGLCANRNDTSKKKQGENNSSVSTAMATR